MATKVLILGAAGRDFHVFNTCYRGRKEYEVVAFTATQIPHIDDRRYPPELAGPGYPDGIPIHPEEELVELIGKLGVELVVFAYSDVKHTYVEERRKVVEGAGARFSTFIPTTEGETFFATSANALPVLCRYSSALLSSETACVFPPPSSPAAAISKAKPATTAASFPARHIHVQLPILSIVVPPYRKEPALKGPALPAPAVYVERDVPPASRVTRTARRPVTFPSFAQRPSLRPRAP